MSKLYGKCNLSYWGWASFIVLLMLAVVFGIRNTTRRKSSLGYIYVSDADSIIHIKGEEVLPVLYNHFPALNEFERDDKVETFLDIMIPSILLAQQKLKAKQDTIREVAMRMKKGKASNTDSLYEKEICKSYRVSSLEEAIDNLQSHPISITLAQAAIESGWGTSRFCYEANNVFGMWSFDESEDRIEAGIERNGKKIYLRRYNSIFESVYDYLNTLARVETYKKFRDARLKTKDSYRLIWYLNNYSERRYEYVRRLRNIIEYNQLTKYDMCRLVSE